MMANADLQTKKISTKHLVFSTIAAPVSRSILSAISSSISQAASVISAASSRSVLLLTALTQLTVAFSTVPLAKAQTENMHPSWPAISTPTISNPTASQPAISTPTASQPTISNPTASQPTISNPTASQPAISTPTASKNSCATLVSETTTSHLPTTINSGVEDIASQVERYFSELKPVLENPYNAQSAAAARFSSLHSRDFTSDFLAFFEKEFRLNLRHRDHSEDQNINNAIDNYAKTVDLLNEKIRRFNESKTPTRFLSPRAFGFDFKNGRAPSENEILELEKKADRAQQDLSILYDKIENKIIENQNSISQVNFWLEKIVHETLFLRAFERSVFEQQSLLDVQDPQKISLRILLAKITESIEYLDSKSSELNQARLALTALYEARLSRNSTIDVVRSKIRYHFEASPTEAARQVGWFKGASSIVAPIKNLIKGLLPSPAKKTELSKASYEEVKKRRYSRDTNDVRIYLNAVKEYLDSWQSDDWLKEFGNDFGWFAKESILHQQPGLPLDVREQAAFECIWMGTDRLAVLKEVLLYFKEHERPLFIKHIKQWKDSSHERRRRLFETFSAQWNTALIQGDLSKLKTLNELNIFDINSRNASGYSSLLRAGQAGQIKVVEWLLQNPELDVDIKDEFGFTDVETLRLSGRLSIANLIEATRPDIKHRHIKSKPTKLSSPAQFIKIYPGQYLKGSGDLRELRKVSRPFELMSKFTDFNTWDEVLHIANAQFEITGTQAHQAASGGGNQASAHATKDRAESIAEKSEMRDSTSPPASPHDQEPTKEPIKKKSFREILMWFSTLNELSHDGNSEVQRQLALIFPGHRKGARYYLLDEIKLEYVARLRGLLDHDYADLVEAHNRLAPHQIGPNKLINGQPIFGLLSQDEFLINSEDSKPMILHIQLQPTYSMRSSEQSPFTNNAVFRIARDL